MKNHLIEKEVGTEVDLDHLHTIAKVRVLPESGLGSVNYHETAGIDKRR